MTTRRLRHLASIRNSNVDKKSDENEQPVRLCNYTDVYHSDTIDEATPFMEATATPEEIRRFTLRKSQVLMTKDSETADDIGVPAYIPHDMPDVVCGYHLTQLTPRRNIDGRFLFWCLRSRTLQAWFEVSARGVTRFALGQDAIGNAPIPFPSLSVQHRIAVFLDRETERIDALVDKKRRLIDLLEEKRTATITHAVTEGLDPTAPMKPSNIPWIGDIPEHWKEAHIIRLANLGSVHTPSRKHPEWWQDCTIPWVTTGEVSQMRDDRIEFIADTREQISEIGLAHSAAELHRANTVVLSRTASAGFSAIMRTDMATSQDFVTWTCGSSLEPRFLLLCLRAMRPDLLGRLAQGSTHKTIYMPEIISIKVPVPLMAEQAEIVESFWDRADSIDSANDALESQITLLAEYREALITAAVTGEIDVDTLDNDRHLEEATP